MFFNLDVYQKIEKIKKKIISVFYQLCHWFLIDFVLGVLSVFSEKRNDNETEGSKETDHETEIETDDETEKEN